MESIVSFLDEIGDGDKYDDDDGMVVTLANGPGAGGLDQQVI